jgi:hypothetical protein
MGGFERHEERRVAAGGRDCYDVLLTVDQGIPHQQNPAGRKLSIILLRSRTNQIEDLLPLVDAILQTIEMIQPGQSIAIPFSY